MINPSVSPAPPTANAPAAAEISPALRTLYRAIFLISLPFGMLDFMLPIYGKRIGASAVEVGGFFSAFSLMVVILRPLVGSGLDRYGRRRFFLAGLGGYALTMLVFAFSTQVAHITLARLLQGISSSLLWLAAQAIISDEAAAHQRGRWFGKLAQSNSGGAIVGTFIGFGILYPLPLAWGWPLMFTAYAAVGFGTFFLAMRKLSETHRRPAEAPTAPIRWTRTWILLMLVTLITGAAWALVSPILMFYLQEKFDTSIANLALAFLPSALVWATLPPYLGRLADRMGRKPLMILGLAAAAISSLMIPLINSIMALAALWAFQALCYAAGDPAEQALVSDLTGGDQRGAAYGLYTTAAGLGAAMGPLAGGWLYDQVSQTAPFLLNAAILAGCALTLALFLKEPARQTQ